jgi:hypothetical protein
LPFRVSAKACHGPSLPFRVLAKACRDPSLPFRVLAKACEWRDIGRKKSILP